MKTIKLYGGSFGLESMLVRCNLTEASAPVEANYGDGWQPTQYQCADCRHRTGGLLGVAFGMAADALLIPEDEFECEWEIVEE